MSDAEKRAYVANMYPSDRWKSKVARMPDSQVIAIYMRDHEKKKNDKPKESDGTGGDDIPF